MCKVVYKRGEIATDWKRSNLVPVYKGESGFAVNGLPITANHIQDYDMKDEPSGRLKLGNSTCKHDDRYVLMDRRYKTLIQEMSLVSF